MMFVSAYLFYTLGGNKMLGKEYRSKFNDKAKELVGQMSLEEKVHLMSGRDDTLLSGTERYNKNPYQAAGNERLNIPNVKFVDGPRGVVSGNATAFPVTMARGATFDNKLEEKVGEAIGAEVRASGGNLFAGVCMNMPYNPGWGRSQEVYGEDTFALGSMAKSLITGVQKQHVMACVKHFAFNSMENARFKINVTASMRTEREQYLSHFKDAVDAGAASIMSSYNHYKGSYAGHSDYLLNKVLKEEWGFDGFVMSDFIWGVNATAEAANGGQDMEMMRTKYFGSKLVEAVKNGEVKEEVIDNAAVRIVRTVLAFEDGAPTFDKSVIAGKEHVDLARKVAQEAITLMKNKNNVLPIANSAKTILVIGKLAESDNIGDHGSSRVYPSTTVSPLEGIKEQFSGAKVIFDEGTDPESTKKQAQNADAVVFVVGYNFDDEGEYTSNDQSDEALFDDNGDDAESSTGFAKGGDRRTLNLHQIDIDLINEVGPVNDNSTVILIGGNTILTHAWQDSVSAILNAYYPGMEGGHAIADILSGQVNPSGKLPFAVPADEKYLPSIDWEATEIEYGYLNGYEKLETEKNEIDFAYGSGLSYSTFDISKVEFNRDGDTLIATANVKNTGSKDGAEVIQLYIGYDESTLEHAHKALKGFERVELNAGEEKKVTVTVPLEKLAYFDESKNAFLIEKINYDCYLGNSSLNAESNHAKLAIR